MASGKMRGAPVSGSASYYDRLADRYTAYYLERSPAGHALRVRQQRVLELLGTSCRRVLDVGCGPGILGEALLERGHEFWGLDAAPEMAERCRKRIGRRGGAHVLVGDALRLPFPDGFFDAVICLGVIGNLQVGRVALGELRRVTRPGGVLLVSLPNPVSPYAAWKSLVFFPALAVWRRATSRLRPGGAGGKFLYGMWKAGDGRRHLHAPGLYTSRTARQVLAAQGSPVDATVYFYFNVFLSPLDQLMPRVSMQACEKLERLRDGWLRWIGSGFILRASREEPATESETCAGR